MAFLGHPSTYHLFEGGQGICMIASSRLARELFQDVLTRKCGVNARQTKFKDVHYLLTMC